MKKFDNNQLKKVLKTSKGQYAIYSLKELPKIGFNDPSHLPFSIKVLLESAIRNCDNYQVMLQDIKTILNWSPKKQSEQEIAFKPGRVILQDFTGVPCVVDLAAMRSAVKKLGGDIKKINPQVQCDLVVDHSVQVDAFGEKSAFKKNVSMEFKRNKERYEFLKWGQNAFKNFTIVPPATGIIHQVNLEYLAQGVLTKKIGKEIVAYPDSLVGTDSHTTMINGIGIVGWGVGGIEAESVMLGEPIYMLLPEVVGFRLTGNLQEGVTATDLVLTVVQMLRKHGVVGKFVEFFGPGLKCLSLEDRATVSNMSPEYGATIGIFPVDEVTLNYYRLTGRSVLAELIEKYFKEQGLFYDPQAQSHVQYSSMIELDLSSVESCVAGPKRPQDRIILSQFKEQFQKSLTASVTDRGIGLKSEEIKNTAVVNNKAKDVMTHGSVVIASITSCTNTSNPSVLIAAGLLAKKAVESGLKIKDFVKTSFVPGSQVAEEYLKSSGLLKYLEDLKFHIVGYGCGPCIGNSGPLLEEVENAIKEGNLAVASVCSGNRNFEGRISPFTKANYLASPPLVVAYALAGTMNIDFKNDPIGRDKKGKEIFLKDIWPANEEIQKILTKFVSAKTFQQCYKNLEHGNEAWQKIKAVSSDLFLWKMNSTYIQEPPFFDHMTLNHTEIKPILGARSLVMVGDSITTDHISPAGDIDKESPAGKYLISLGVSPQDFNSYGARRGNDRVMVRGTFANIRLRNQLAPGTEGSWTTHFPDGQKLSIFDASEKYKQEGVPLVVLAGKEYGTGSSRDWAAKGPALLGIKVVLAESYERIHRSNLAGMGILPLEYQNGESAKSLGLKGNEIFDFNDVSNNLHPRQTVTVKATSQLGKVIEFKMIVRLDTPVEIDYFRNGGIMQTVIRKLV